MIYNATIDSELQTLDQLEKARCLRTSKAVKPANVWCTEEPVPVHNGAG